MDQRPALEITSEGMGALCTEVAHTAQDRPELVEIAHALHDLLLRLEG